MLTLSLDTVLSGLECPHNRWLAVEQFIDPEDIADALVHFRKGQVSVVVGVELEEQGTALRELGFRFLGGQRGKYVAVVKRHNLFYNKE